MGLRRGLLCVLALSGLMWAADEKQPMDPPANRPAETAKPRETTRKLGVGAAESELTAFDFVVQGNSCFTFDSFVDLAGAERVSISILALNVNLRDTVIIPFFGVPFARFLTAGQPIRGSDFFYVDGGGASVPVLGPTLKIRVCNNAPGPITYTHLTAYAAAR